MAPPWSPPTRRVVAVVELIAESERPLSVSVIAERLSLARATVTAVLGELRAAQWVTRDDRLCYRPGPALTRLSARGPPAPARRFAPSRPPWRRPPVAGPH
ncbi:helix-turn-helix domain-containing protein [Nocardia brevicatena]|uniref:helix-turn-helix domain-containing protein n=1 Tax=Nocardia brevicatena TaxID=37327 RepID=UPI001FDEEBFD|nr:helix-turn-helix domain-containing protein [Nocardia brevicatena]